MEKSVQNKVIQELRDFGCKVYKMKPGYGIATGTLDCVFFYKSFYGWIEFKASKDAPYRPLQPENLELYGEWSWSATIWPENKEQVMEELWPILRKLKYS